MARITRSCKGEIVDFDLITIKQQMADMPQPTIVKTRQEFIENRLNRKNKIAAGLIEDDIIQELEETELSNALIEIDIEEPAPIKQKARK